MPTEENTVRYHAMTRALQSETSAESEILLPDYYPGIMKLIHTDSGVMVRNQSVRGDRAYVDGAVEFRILYLSEGNDGFHSVFYQIPFSCSTELHSAEPDTAQIRVTPRLTYVNTRALSPRKLYAKAVLSLSFYVFEPSSFPKADDTGAAGLITQTKEYTLSDILLSPTKTIKLSGEADPGTGVHPTQILRYEVSFSEPEKKTIHTKTIVKSELKIKIYYTVSGENTVRSTAAQIPFSQVIETPEAATAENTFVRLQLSDCHLSVREKSQNASVIEIDAEVSVSADCFSNEKLEIASDAFSLTNDIRFTARDISLQTVLPLSVPFEIRDSLPVGDGEHIVDVCTDTELVSSSYNDAAKTAELACRMSCHLICENESGEYSESLRDLTFTCAVPVSEVCRELFADAVFRFSALDILPTDRAVEIRAAGTCSGLALLRRQCTRVSDISVSDKRKTKMPGFVAYRTEEKEGLWEIAKRYSADPEEIRQTNGITGEETEGKRMIFIRR